MNLSRYKCIYDPGAPIYTRALWHFVGQFLFETRLLPFSRLKSGILRLFGAKIGKGVVIKSQVKVKSPWKLTIGDNTWLGEGSWVDNVAEVRIGSNTCVSQGVYICGGDHDFKKETFDLRLRPVTIGDKVWLAARCIVAPGSNIKDGAVITLGSTFKGETKKDFIYSGNPATEVKRREITEVFNSTKNILFINQSFYPDNSATSQYLTELCTYLVEKGHSVTVLCSRQDYLKKNNLHSPSENYQGVNIIRVSAFQLQGSSKIRRIINGLLMNLSFLIKMLTLPRFDTVVAMTSPPLIAWTALVFLKKPVDNFIYWLMDLNPDQAIQAGWVKKGSITAKLLEFALRYTINNSDRVIVLDEDMKSLITPRTLYPAKIEIVPLWISKDLKADRKTKAAQPNQFRIKNKLNDKFVIMYSGNLSLCHPVSTLLAAADKLKDDPSLTFVVVGSGPGLEQVLKYKEEKSLQNLWHFPYQERSELCTSLSAADLHLISQGDGYSGIVHPSKIYGILGVEKPFILLGPEDSFINKQYVKFNLGARVSHGDINGLTNIIYKFKNKEEPNIYKKQTASRIKKSLSHTNVLSKLESLL